MDLGCLDLCSISVLEKQQNNDATTTTTVAVDSEKKKDDGDSPPISSKSGKNKASKGTGLSAHTAVNKSYSQLKKPNRKSSSPLNWFPRKKVDSYLKRKIRLLQEGTSSLDETLGDSNPHYSRVLREKIAVSEAACKAMEARKTAMVEASWCRILRAARIQSKEAEALLQEAEKNVAEAFEAAAALGVIMYDRPDCPRKSCEVESSSTNLGGSTTHTVTASFETAFEVDKEVAAAVKAAFIRLANCPSSLDKDEHRDLLRRISQNPDMNEAIEEVSECSSGCESDTRSEHESESLGDVSTSQFTELKVPGADRQKKSKSKRLPDISSTKLIDMMLERIKCLQEDELASLATIVATCGLNAVLLEIENTKRHDTESRTDFTFASVGNSTKTCSVSGGTISRELPSLDKFLVKRMSRLEREVQEAKNRRKNASKGETVEENLEGSDNRADSSVFGGTISREQVVPEIPSLDKFLVKRMSRLEREVQEAKNRRKNASKGETVEENLEGSDNRADSVHSNDTISEAVPDLGSIFVKHASKLEKEIEIAKKTSGKEFEMKRHHLQKAQDDVPGLPSLDKFLVKHVSRLEREIQDAKKNRRKNDSIERNSASMSESFAPCEDMTSLSCEDGKRVGKENIDLNKQSDELSDGTVKEVVEFEQSEKHDTSSSVTQDKSIDDSEKKSLTMKTMSRIERAKLETLEAFSSQDGNPGSESECSLDRILVKPVHRLEKEKKQALALGMDYGTRSNKKKHEWINGSHCESLDKVLVKHIPRLDKAKMEWGTKEEEKAKMVSTSKEEEKKATQTKNCSDSLDQILVKHVSRLEKAKLAASQQSVDEIKHSRTRREARERELQDAWGGLSLGDSVGVQSRLEKKKSTSQHPADEIKLPRAQRAARERELQEAWGGLSLGNSVRPHLSRLERDKAAWMKADQEEESRAGLGMEA